jgi:hypothetical protein
MVLSFLLLGCAPSTHDLIEQAHLTGDWTHVNQRLETLEKRKKQVLPSCPRGETRVCNNRFGDERCDCLRNTEVRRMLSGLGW